MHWLGLDGMPRDSNISRINGLEVSNLVASLGSFILGFGVLIFIYNVIYSRKGPKNAGNDPWDGRTLEWSIPSPPPHYNFETIPEVKYRDDFGIKNILN